MNWSTRLIVFCFLESQERNSSPHMTRPSYIFQRVYLLVLFIFITVFSSTPVAFAEPNKDELPLLDLTNLAQEYPPCGQSNLPIANNRLYLPLVQNSTATVGEPFATKS